MDDEKRLLFVDLETTGLDANSDVPLELAVVLTDEWGDIIDTFVTQIHDGTLAFRQAIDAGKDHKIGGRQQTVWPAGATEKQTHQA